MYKGKEKELVFLISMLCLTFEIHPVWSLIVSFALLIIALSLKFKEVAYLYIFLSIWSITLFQGSYQIFILLIETILLIKGIKHVLQNKLSIRLKEVLFIVIITLFTTISFLIYTDLSSIRILLNVIIVLLLKITYLNEKDDNFIKSLFIFYIVSISVGVLYGLINQNFMDVRYGTGRFNGLQAPNYMALYTNIGILILLFLEGIRNNLRVILLIWLYFSLLLTQSTSGMLINLVILMIFVSIKYKSFFVRPKVIVLTCFLFILTILYFSLWNDDFSLKAIERIYNRWTAESTIGSLTNDRSTMWTIYLSEFINLNVFEIIFGVGSLSPMLIISQTVGSHSTYIDILWFAGIFGLTFLIWYVLSSIWDYKRSVHFQLILSIKFVLLLNMISISLLSNRFFVILLLL